MRDQLLAEPETPAGMQALQRTYREIIEKRRRAKESDSPAVRDILAMATISNYLHTPENSLK
jgi:hypothetical protein